MTTGTHAVVWIDSREAKIAFADADSTGEYVVRSEGGRRHLHARAGSPEGYSATADHVFFQRVANDLVDFKSFIVVGPAQVKIEFVKHLHRYAPHLFPRLAAVESADQMTDGELTALARKYFKKADTLIQHPVRY